MQFCVIKLNENQTRYEFEYEYTRIDWIIPRLMAMFFPSMCHEPAEKWLTQFKAFAERHK